MRASSLSDKQVIELLTKYFVPVFIARDDSRDLQPSKADQEEVLRISRECRVKKLEAGSVCAFVVHPDGSVLTAKLVQQASKPEVLIPLLKEIVAKENVTPRDQEAARPAPLRKPVRPKSDGGIVLHVWTRFEGDRARYGLSEDWLELVPADWEAFAPPAGAKPGDTWPVPDKVLEKVARYFYPPGPNWDVRQSKVTKAAVTATLATAGARGPEVSLRGTVELSYPFAGPGTDGVVTAPLVGVARFAAEGKKLTKLSLVSDEARFVWQWQGQPRPEKMAVAVELEGP